MKLDLKKLKDNNFPDNFANQMDTKLDMLTFPDTTVKGEWEIVKSALFDTAKGQLARPIRTNKDWFNDNDEKLKHLIQERNTVRSKYMQIVTRRKGAKLVDARRSLHNHTKKLKLQRWKKKKKKTKFS